MGQGGVLNVLLRYAKLQSWIREGDAVCRRCADEVAISKSQLHMSLQGVDSAASRLMKSSSSAVELQGSSQCTALL